MFVSAAPARMFGLYGKKGVIQPGADADIVVYDPDRPWTISVDTHHMRLDYSAYELGPLDERGRLQEADGIPGADEVPGDTVDASGAARSVARALVAAEAEAVGAGRSLPERLLQLPARHGSSAMRRQVRERESPLPPGQSVLDAPAVDSGHEPAAQLDSRLRQGFAKVTASGWRHNRVMAKLLINITHGPEAPTRAALGWTAVVPRQGRGTLLPPVAGPPADPVVAGPGWLGNGLVSVGGEVRVPLTAPIDIAFTAGAQGLIGDTPRVGGQVGFVAGQPLPAGTFTVTPYIHPRLAIVASPGGDDDNGLAEDDDDVDLDVRADIGADFDFASNVSLRFGINLAEGASWGLGLAWRR